MRFGAALLLALWSLQAAAKNSPSSLERTLVDASLGGYVEFDLMAIRFPREAEALAEKMQKALDEQVIELQVLISESGRLVFEYTNKKTVNGEFERSIESILASTGKTSRSGNR